MQIRAKGTVGIRRSGERCSQVGEGIIKLVGPLVGLIGVREQAIGGVRGVAKIQPEMARKSHDIPEDDIHHVIAGPAAVWVAGRVSPRNGA